MAMRRIALLAALAFAVPRPASAALRVVSSIPTLGSLAKEVGGDRVEVESLGRATRTRTSSSPSQA